MPKPIRRRTMATATRLAAPALAAALLVTVATLTAAAAAHAAKPGEGAASAAPTVPAEPGQTMATFGDWVVRCERPASPAPNQPASGPVLPKRVCEAAQALVIKGQQAPVAQIAFGHVPAEGKGPSEKGGNDKGGGDKGDAGLTLTVLLPVNISFGKPPRLAGAEDKDGTALILRRCLPGGCLADAHPTAELLRGLRGEAKPAYLSFTDAAERTLTLPFSTRGLAQALDDLARETARDGKDNG